MPLLMIPSCCWCGNFDTTGSASTPYLQRGSALLSVDNRRLYCFKEAQRTLKKHGITVPLREGWELRLGNLLQSWGIGVMDGKDHVTLGVVGMKVIGDF